MAKLLGIAGLAEAPVEHGGHRAPADILESTQELSNTVASSFPAQASVQPTGRERSPEQVVSLGVALADHPVGLLSRTVRAAVRERSPHPARCRAHGVRRGAHLSTGEKGRLEGGLAAASCTGTMVTPESDVRCKTRRQF